MRERKVGSEGRKGMREETRDEGEERKKGENMCVILKLISEHYVTILHH